LVFLEIAAGFHHTPSLPGFSATTACPIPTARAPIGSRRKAVPVAFPLSCAATFPEPRKIAASAIALERTSLIHEHDGNVIADGIAQLARRTDKAGL
jgi:hypothetical protein